MLLLGMLQPPSVAAEVILHVWFSARLTSPILQKFKEIGPLIADVVGKIRDRRADVLLSKTWSFGTRQVSVRMYKKQWNTLLAMLDADHDVAETERNRLHIMLNATRLDYQERHLLFLPPAQRVCSHKMRKTGVLVPFGSSLEQFNCPNP